MKRSNVLFGFIYLVVVLLSLPHVLGITSEEHPCLEFTFDKCNLDPSWIIPSSEVVSEEIECQKMCRSIPECKFYIYKTDSSTCQLINQPEQTYLDTCMELGLSGSHTITECKDSNDHCKVYYA